MKNRKMALVQTLRVFLLLASLKLGCEASCIDEINACFESFSTRLIPGFDGSRLLDVARHEDICSALLDADDSVFTPLADCLVYLASFECVDEQAIHQHTYAEAMANIIRHPSFCDPCYLKFSELNTCALEVSIDIQITNVTLVNTGMCLLNTTSPSKKWLHLGECVDLQRSCDIINMTLSHTIQELDFFNSFGLNLTQATYIVDQCTAVEEACFLDVQACFSTQPQLAGLAIDTDKDAICGLLTTEVADRVVDCLDAISADCPLLTRSHQLFVQLCSNQECDSDAWQNVDTCVIEHSPQSLLTLWYQLTDGYPPAAITPYCTALLAVVQCLKSHFGDECTVLQDALSPYPNRTVTEVGLAGLTRQDIMNMGYCQEPHDCVKARECAENLATSEFQQYLNENLTFLTSRDAFCIPVKKSKKDGECLEELIKGCYQPQEYQAIYDTYWLFYTYCNDGCDDLADRVEKVQTCLDEAEWDDIQNFTGIVPTSDVCNKASEAGSCIAEVAAGCPFLNKVINSTIYGDYGFGEAINISSAISLFMRCNYVITYDNAAGTMGGMFASVILGILATIFSVEF